MKVVTIKKGARGVVTSYKLDDGRVVDNVQAAQMVQSGELSDYLRGKSIHGRLSVRTRPTLSSEDNIKNLPTF